LNLYWRHKESSGKQKAHGEKPWALSTFKFEISRTLPILRQQFDIADEALVVGAEEIHLDADVAAVG
jgi:hypothetical protein